MGLLLANLLALEEHEGDEVGEEVHLGAGFNGGCELGEGLGVAAHALVEVCAGDSPVDVSDGLLDELLRHCLHCYLIILIIILQC